MTSQRSAASSATDRTILVTADAAGDSPTATLNRIGFDPDLIVDSEPVTVTPAGPVVAPGTAPENEPSTALAPGRVDTEARVLPVDPDIKLVGPQLLDPHSTPSAPVDGVAVMVIGPKAKSPHLVYVNDGLCQLVGWRSDQLIGQSPAILFTTDKGPGELEAMKRALLPHRDTQLLDLLEHARSEVDEPGTDLIDSYQHTVIDQWVREQGDWSTTGGDSGTGRYIEIGSDSPPQVPTGTDRSDPGRSGVEALDPGRVESGQPGANGSSSSDSITIDLAPAAGDHQYSSLTHLVTRQGERVPILFTAHAIASASAPYPNVVAQFRDLRRASAERLIADKEAVISSLKRGHQLGQLCHQIAIMIEKSLGVQAACWISMMGTDGDFEPVIAGGFDIDIVAATTGALARSSKRPTKRVASVRGLAAPLADSLRDNGITNLWYVPVLSEDGEAMDRRPGANVITGSTVTAGPGSDRQTAAIVVAAGDVTPDREATEILDHLATVLATGIDHASIESNNAHSALHDPLTRLPNRALIVDRLAQAMARLERDGVALSVLLVDIDRFKHVNDSRGIEAGDRVLVEVANRLLAAVRLGDTVGRISSDQFLVMCVATNGELDTTSVARRVLRSLAEPIAVGEGDDIHITASIGAVVVKEAGQSPAGVISSAESALADAEAMGRGKYAMFKAEHQHDLVARHQTEQDLHRAITDNELVVHYQPLVEIKSGFMVGVEALLRWERPGHGLLGPAEFIPVAEESELIVPMGEWVIDQVCEDLARWPKARGRSPLVSINLAARHLEIDTLVPTVIRALQRNGLHPRRLGFEITESMEVADTEAALANLNKLSELGCHIAIDDFGVGHASLDYLRRFPMATALKIDRSFIAGLTRSREDRAIVTASIAMAESLGLESVAEGVESVEQLLTLRDMGCRYAQGFVLSRALPLDIVVQLWTRAQFYRSASLGGGRAAED